MKYLYDLATYTSILNEREDTQKVKKANELATKIIDAIYANVKKQTDDNIEYIKIHHIANRTNPHDWTDIVIDTEFGSLSVQIENIDSKTLAYFSEPRIIVINDKGLYGQIFYMYSLFSKYNSTHSEKDEEEFISDIEIDLASVKKYIYNTFNYLLYNRLHTILVHELTHVFDYQISPDTIGKRNAFKYKTLDKKLQQIITKWKSLSAEEKEDEEISTLYKYNMYNAKLYYSSYHEINAYIIELFSEYVNALYNETISFPKTYQDFESTILNKRFVSSESVIHAMSTSTNAKKRIKKRLYDFYTVLTKIQ